ncbi:hypothetical protein [Azotobacter armeniacus]
MSQVSSPNIMFVFPGQGSQYVGMGNDIHRQFSSVREVDDPDQLRAALFFQMFYPVKCLRDNNGCDDEAMVECFLSGQANSRSVLYRQSDAMNIHRWRRRR